MLQVVLLIGIQDKLHINLFSDFIDNMKASTKSGWMGGTYSKKDFKENLR